MKTVFTNKELPHIWAHKSQSYGRSASMLFEDETIFSYGKHFPMARHITDKDGNACVLFTTRTRSVTTANHLRLVSRAIPDGVPVYHVANVTYAPADYMLKEYSERINVECNCVRASRSGVRVGYLTRMIQEAERFKQAFRLKGGIPHPDMSAEIAKAERWNAAVSIRTQETAARNFEKNKKDTIKHLEKFLGVSPLPFEVKPGMAYLRRAAVAGEPGDYAETTQGARVPLEHVLRVAPLVLDMLKKGKTYKKNGHTIHLGNYTLDEITEDGTVIAGCHKFSREEVERFAKTIGLEV